MSVLWNSPAASQGSVACEEEGITLRIKTEVITILNSLRKVCQTPDGPQLMDNNNTVVVKGIWGYTYQLCVKSWVLDIIAVWKANPSLPLDALKQELNDRYRIITDACVAQSNDAGLNIDLPKGVKYLPFPAGVGRNGVIVIHPATVWNQKLYVEGWNFILWPDGTYYLQNPLTGERLLSGKERLENFIIALQGRIQSWKLDLLDIRQIIVDTAKEVQ